MTVANFRRAYFEIVQELHAITDGQDDRNLAWLVEYLGRDGIWFQFSGLTTQDGRVSSGREWDLNTSLTTEIDVHSISLALLHFAANRTIAAYCGEAKSSIEIFEDISAISERPEVLAVYLKEGEPADDDRGSFTATNFVFLGFESARYRWAKPRRTSASIISASAPNKSWYGGRRYIEAKAPLLPAYDDVAETRPGI